MLSLYQHQIFFWETAGARAKSQGSSCPLPASPLAPPALLALYSPRNATELN